MCMYIVQRPPLENSDLLLFSEDRAEISSRAREILEFSALYIPLYTHSACMNNLYILVFVATYSRKIFFFSSNACRTTLPLEIGVSVHTIGRFYISAATGFRRRY